MPKDKEKTLTWPLSQNYIVKLNFKLTPVHHLTILSVCVKIWWTLIWILQIREISFLLFNILYISLFTVRCFVFNQTTFKRQIAPTDNSSSPGPPMFDNSPLTRAECFQECHYAPGCQSVVVEGEHCRLYTDTGNHGDDSFNVVRSLSYSNLDGNI